MRELEIYRRHQRGVAQQAVGVLRGANLVTKAAVANAQADFDVERLPEGFDEDGGEIQTSGGAFGYMIDYSPVDGPDPIM